MTQANDLPFLSWDDLEEGRTFQPFRTRVESSDIDVFRTIVGDLAVPDSSTVPPGFAGIWGRRSYLERHRMPPGGVLLAFDVRWLAPARAGEDVVATAVVRQRQEKDGKRSVIIRTTAIQGEQTVAEITSRLGWPT